MRESDSYQNAILALKTRGIDREWKRNFDEALKGVSEEEAERLREILEELKKEKDLETALSTERYSSLRRLLQSEADCDVDYIRSEAKKLTKTDKKRLSILLRERVLFSANRRKTKQFRAELGEVLTLCERVEQERREGRPFSPRNADDISLSTRLLNLVCAQKSGKDISGTSPLIHYFGSAEWKKTEEEYLMALVAFLSIKMDLEDSYFDFLRKTEKDEYIRDTILEAVS